MQVGSVEQRYGHGPAVIIAKTKKYGVAMHNGTILAATSALTRKTPIMLQHDANNRQKVLDDAYKLFILTILILLAVALNLVCSL